MCRCMTCGFGYPKLTQGKNLSTQKIGGYCKLGGLPRKYSILGVKLRVHICSVARKVSMLGKWQSGQTLKMIQ